MAYAVHTMPNSFFITDFLIAAILVLGIVSPARLLRFSKVPADRHAELHGRVRWIAIGVAVLFVIGRFAMMKFFPQFGRL